MTKVITHEGSQLTLQVTVTLTDSLLEMEKAILDGCNEIGSVTAAHALQKFERVTRISLCSPQVG